jgi:hypothetical protein
MKKEGELRAPGAVRVEAVLLASASAGVRSVAVPTQRCRRKGCVSDACQKPSSECRDNTSTTTVQEGCDDGQDC